MRSHAVVAPRGHVRPGASRDGLTHRETTAGAPVAGYAAVTLSRMRSADIHLDHHRGAPASGSNLSAGEPPANLSVARPLRRDGTSRLPEVLSRIVRGAIQLDALLDRIP